MDIFVQDTKLNISPTYLKPGFAFGGSCLPKDVRAITYDAKTKDLKLPLLDSLMISNEFQVERVIEWILNRKNKKVGILGLSFKGDTDDIRESPIVKVVESLLGKGFEVVIYDPNINLSKLIGANKQFIEKEIPHIARLMSNSIDHLLGTAEVILIANHNPEFKKVTSQLKSNQVVLDLVRITEETKNIIGDYEGICW
jgi:GDP-mannose 6-dehydrogenase